MYVLHALDRLAQLAGISLISGIWQGLVLAAAVGLCLRLVPKASAALRFAVWSIVFVLIAVLPLAESLHPGHAVPPVSGSMVRLDVRWSVAVAALWIVLTGVRAAHLAIHAVRLWLLRRRAMPFKADAACAALLNGSPRKVRLCTSLEVDRPSVIGFFAPRILIPGWLIEQLTTAELEQIVLHEIEHLRRGDDWLNLVQKLSLVLFPLNPILFWIERRLCFERELACDDGVLRRTKAPRAYATCLTNLAEWGLDRRAAASLALGALERRSELARRVHRILRREAALSPPQTRALTGAVALGLLGGMVGLARCPQLVSFAVPAPHLSAAAYPFAPSAGSAAYHAERVVYSGSTAAHTPHMALLKASLSNENWPNRRVPAGTVLQRVVRRPQRTVDSSGLSSRSLQRVKAYRAPAPGWVVLTSWPDAVRHAQSVKPVRPRTTDRPLFLPYAAVHVDGGWLILQL